MRQEYFRPPPPVGDQRGWVCFVTQNAHVTLRKNGPSRYMEMSNILVPNTQNSRELYFRAL